MEQKISTTALTESAIMAALISIIVIVSSYFSIIQGIAMMILPMIIAIVHYKHGIKYSVGCSIVSTLIASVMFNPITAFPIGVNYGIIGVTLGYAIKKEYSPYKILIFTMLASVVSIVVVFIAGGYIMTGQNVFQFMKSMATEASNITIMSIDEAIKFYESMGMSGQQIEVFNYMKSVMKPEFILMSIPSAIVLTSFLQGYINLQLISLMLKRLRYAKLEIIKFREFYVTNLVGAALIGTMCIMLILYGRGVLWGLTVYKSVYMITIVILSINGVAATVYLLTNKIMVRKVARVLIIIGMFFMGLSVVFAIVGFVEMLLDFRKLDPHRLRKA